MIRLGVNVDHVATVRQARREQIPSVVDAAKAAETSGADGITVHLREDRRHIQDHDVSDLKRSLRVPLNLEMAVADEIVGVALKVRPTWCCLVPEKREELTTEGGLNIERSAADIKATVSALKEAGIRVSLFVDPDVRVMDLAQDVGADAVELHTGTFARLWHDVRLRKDAEFELKAHKQKIQAAAERAASHGLIVNAGHGIDYENVRDLRPLFKFSEFNIGFSIIARAMMVGIGQAVKEMKQELF